jgi:Domain of unknown function (DU1801)
MPENKTKATSDNVAAFLAAVEPEQKRRDAKTVCALMHRLTGDEPVMWGPSMIGFGRYRYKYDSGREGEMFRLGFSPRKAKLVLYIVDGFPEHAGLLAKLGKHKTGKSCLYLNTLADADPGVLEELMRRSIAVMAQRYPVNPAGAASR